MSHINTSSESVEWISVGMVVQEESSMYFTRVKKLLGFTPSTPGVMDMEMVSPSLNAQHGAHDHGTDMMEEDVWGNNDGDTSSLFDEDENSTPSSMQWPDSESGSHFSALLDEVAGRDKVAGIFSPSQFSPVDTRNWEAMHGQIFGTSDTMSSGRDTRDITGNPSHKGIFFSNKSVLPDYGPRSAPVEVPVWSKLHVMMKNRGTFVGHDVDMDDVHVKRVPPHELVAKQHARSQISAFSVIEGTGRTLKGRDVSKVRNAVWKQTGFDG